MLGLHAFDFSAYAPDFQLDRHNVRKFAGALAKKFGEPLFGVAGIGEACFAIDILGGYFFASLRFGFDMAEISYFRDRGVALVGGYAQGCLESASKAGGAVMFSWPK